MTIYAKSSEFKKDLQELAKTIEHKYQGVFRIAMLGLVQTVAERTPIDTGRASGSWSISRDTIGRFMVPEGQHSSPEEATERARRLMFSNPYAVWYIYNNVPYIIFLEYGWSSQAPEGMLRLSVEEFKDKLEKELKRVLP